MREKIVVAIALLLTAERAKAAGFHIDEQDARATGRAGAVTANPANASAIYYNPGGVGPLEGLHIDLGASLIGPKANFEATGSRTAIDADNKVFILPQAYLTYRISDLVGVGLGLNAPFGLKVEWPATSPGRTIVRNIELRTYFITPVVALNLSRWVPGLSIGAGPDLVPASVRLDRDILFGSDVATVALSGTAFGAGARAGVLYRPKGFENFSFGVTYRTPVKLNFDGQVNFSASPIYRSSLPPDGDTKTSLTLPQELNFGVAFQPIPEWELELDYDWTGWSSYQSLTIDLPANQTLVSAKNWRNTSTLRVGTEVRVASAWSVRGGVAWDRTPVPATTLDFQLPDANRLVLAAGVGWGICPAVRADFGAIYIPPTGQTTSFADPLLPPIKGTFEASAFVAGLSVGLKLDQPAPTPGTPPASGLANRTP